MAKEFHVWFCTCKEPNHAIMQSVLWLMKRNQNVHTCNLIFADMRIITKWGYRLYIHPTVGDPFEITLGKCANTSREIKPETNILNLLLSGEFDTDDVKVVREVL